MSVKTHSQLTAETNTVIFENSSELITAASVNQLEIDIIDTMFSLSGSGTSGNLWAAGSGTGSIVDNNGTGNIASSIQTLAAGKANTASGPYATVAGGRGNIASGQGSFIGSGIINYATTNNSVVVSGLRNLVTGNMAGILTGYKSTASGTYSVVLGGYLNTAYGGLSSVGGGRENKALGFSSNVGGGFQNTASGLDSTVAGGYQNTVNATCGFIGNGQRNIVSGKYAVVAGGYKNTASDIYNTIAGGKGNKATGQVSTVVGGESNTASGALSFVGAGYVNKATAPNAVVVGGRLNTASQRYSSVVGGQYNTVSGYRSSVVGGLSNFVSADESNIDGGQRNIVGGGTVTHSNVGGGQYNTINTFGHHSVIAGGGRNTITQQYGSIGGGVYNTVTHPEGSIGGGSSNTVSGDFGTIAGGQGNLISGKYSSILGGGGYNYSSIHYGNTISGNYSSVLGGRANSVYGDFSTVAAGSGNTVTGRSSGIGAGTGLTNSLNNTWMSQNIIGTQSISGGTFYSGGTDLYNIFLTTGDGNDITRVQNGTNTTTGGTGNNPTVNLVASPSINNLTFSGTATGHAISATTISATTYYSGSTLLSSILTGGTSANLWSASAGVNSIIANNGSGNLASGNYAITGGKLNTASGYASNISGGRLNTSSNDYSTIGGGQSNIASAQRSVIGGGLQNTTSGMRSSVLGGVLNVASGRMSNVGGGQSNVASGNYSNVSGGYKNTTIGVYSNVAGGYNNTISGKRANITGGIFNTITGDYSTIVAGHHNLVNSKRSGIGAGSNLTNPWNDTWLSQNITGGTISGGTFFSGVTPLSQIITTLSPPTDISGKYDKSGGTISGSITVAGDATIMGSVYVFGTATTLHTQTVSTDDNNIELNTGTGATHTTAIGGGICVRSGQTSGVASSIITDADGNFIASPGFYSSVISGNTILSAGTDLYNIFLTTADGNDITRVQPGSNILTGGTGNLPIISLTASPFINNLTSSGLTLANTFSANTISGGTFYSGSSELGGVIYTPINSQFSVVNNQLITKANLSGATFTNQVNVNILSATTLSATTIYSPTLDLKAIMFVGIDATTPISASDISIDYSTRVLTITPPLGYFNFFVDGGGIASKFTKTGNVAFPAFSDISGIVSFYFDASGNATVSNSDVEDGSDTLTSVYTLIWNSTLTGSSKSVVEVLETHQNLIPAIDHRWKHKFGTIWNDGFDIFDNVLASGTPNADGRNTCISLNTGMNIDDDLEYTITNSTASTVFNQDLGNVTPALITSGNSGLFTIRYQDVTSQAFILPATRFPFAWDTATDRPQFIDSVGTRTLVTAGNFFVYYVFAVQDPRFGCGVKTISSPIQYNTLTLAQAGSWLDITSTYIILSDEIRPLYKLIFQYQSGYSANCKKAVLRQVEDIRTTKVVSLGTLAGSLPASSVTLIPTDSITSTNVQSAFAELPIIYLGLTGGTLTGGLSATSVSASTIYSGSTNLDTVIRSLVPTSVLNVNAGSNITTGGTATSPIISLNSSPSLNNLAMSGTGTFNLLNSSVFSGTTFSGTTGIFTSLSANTLTGSTLLLSSNLSANTVYATAVSGTTSVFSTSTTSPLIIGGILPGSSLTFYSTSGTGSTGSDIIFKGGTNGSIETMRIKNGNPITAVGGTITTNGGYTIHTFTSTGDTTLTVNGNLSVEYLVVAGGGGGGSSGVALNVCGGGGGAGGFLTGSTGLIATGYTITVGYGGMGSVVGTGGTSGDNSIISGVITAHGGGRGEAYGIQSPAAGGSGGGGGYYQATGGSGIAGEGFKGGDGNTGGASAGGGGALAVGANVSGTNGSNGGTCASSSISGVLTNYAGGGGGGCPIGSTAGSGGGATAGNGGLGLVGGSASPNTGSGGGGGGEDNAHTHKNGGNGGSGIVIIRYLTPSAYGVGIGTVSPTALLHLTAGTVSVGTAPLKFSSGTLLGTPESGATEYDGTSLYFSRTGTTRETIVTATGVVGPASASGVTGTVQIVISGVTYNLLYH